MEKQSKSLQKRRTLKKKKTARRKRTGRKRTTITVRRSSGRKEKFDFDRLTKVSSRSGIPFPMARDMAKNISKKIRTEANGRGKKTVTAARLRKMITKELHDRNQRTIASSYEGSTAVGVRSGDFAVNVEPGKSHIGTADTDQHNAFRADRDSVMHDRSKRLGSSS